jgi:hypothetical protein
MGVRTDGFYHPDHITYFYFSTMSYNVSRERLGTILLLLALVALHVKAAFPKFQRSPTEALPESHPLLKRDIHAGPFTPEQIRVSYAGPGAVTVAWVTWPGEYSVLAFQPHRKRRLSIAESVRKRKKTVCDGILEMELVPAVRWGYSSDHLDNAEEGDFTCYSTVAYDSGALHHVTIGSHRGPLLPGAYIYYKVGDAKHDVWSDVLQFRMSPPAGQLPVRLGLLGDLGQTKHSLQTLDHINANSPDSVMLVGDMSYADGYHPRWDTWGRMVSNHTSRLVWMYTEGNHEKEASHDKYNTPDFLAYMKRFKMPYEHSGSPTQLYYSYDVAGAHIVMLGSYADFEEGSEQYKWLEKDLAKVSRHVTPWIIVGMHAPWYNSNHNHFGEGEKMRLAMESILYQHGVDIVVSGHVHAFERSYPVYNMKNDDCGPVHINIGDGGNREGLDFDYFKQPAWSAVREPSYGHGILDLIDANSAQFEWFRNVDGMGKVSDSVVIHRATNCTNKI